MDNKKKYKKLKSGGAGAHGVDYQIKLLTLFLLDAYQRGIEFRLSTENENSGKFDDVVLETEYMSILLQAKHKERQENHKNFLTFNDIFPTGKHKDDFNLHKYLKSFSGIKNNFKNVSALIFCTNTTLTNDQKDKIKDYTRLCTMKKEHVLYSSSVTGYYTFNENCKIILRSANPQMIDDDITLFLNKLQLVSVNDTHLNTKIETLVKKNNLFDPSNDLKHSIHFLKENIKSWFENTHEGIYITRRHVESFRSKYFINELEKFDVRFEIPSTTTFNYKYFCYIIQNRDMVFLHLLKIYQSIKNQKTLVVNPTETTVNKINIINSFKIDEYVYLVIPLFKEEYCSLKSIMKHIASETLVKVYKKMIFVIDTFDIVENLSYDLNCTMDWSQETIKFESFSEKNQTEICLTTVNFQGKDLPLAGIVSQKLLNTILDELILLRLINKETIIINQRYKDTNTDYYISRSLYTQDHIITTDYKYDNISISEDTFCEDICEECGVKITLLINDPGMGKTTVLSNFQKVINSRSNLWLTKIALNEFTELFKMCLTDEIEITKLLDLLVFHQYSDIPNFEKRIFYLSNKAIIILDGVDEMHPNYFTVVSKLIKLCMRLKNIKNVLITSRRHCYSDIIEIVGDALVYSLNKFSENDQVHFLHKYWTAKLKLTSLDDISACRQFVIILKNTLNSPVKGTSSFAGIPLQTKMIGEVFEKHCLSYVKGNYFEAKSLKNLNIANLYDMVVEKKKNIYVEEKCNARGNIIVESTLHAEFDKAIEEHTILAIRTILETKHYHYFEILHNQNWRKILNQPVIDGSIFKMGILEEYENEFKFVHRTFAEYFVAKCICHSLNNLKIKNKFLCFLMKDVFISNKYPTLQLFINSMLEYQTIPDSILKKLSTIFKKLKWNFYRETEIINLGKNGYINLLKIMFQTINSCECVLKKFKDSDLLSHSLNDVSLFTLLLERGANVFTIDKFGLTLLHLASQNNCYQVINLLIEKSLDINAQDSERNSPLHYAAQSNSIKAMEILINREADINITNIHGQTPLIMAYSYLAIECGLMLIYYGADVAKTDNLGRNILHIMLSNCRFENIPNSDYESHINTILRRNVTVANRTNNFGYAPLHYAVARNNTLAIQLLLAAGADSEIRNTLTGETPLLMACRLDSSVCINFLINSGANITIVNKKRQGILHMLTFCSSRNLEESRKTFKKILEHSIDLDRTDVYGMTALHYAVRKNYIVETNLLLDAGADKDLPNNDAKTPLLLACSTLSLDCVLCLLNNQADVTAVDNKGRNILHHLSSLLKNNETFDYEFIISKILNNNYVDIDSTDNNGNTALHLAVYEENGIAINLLLAANANTEIRNYVGLTPLLSACLHESFNCAICLIDRGADLTLVENKGRNILHCLLKGHIQYAVDKTVKKILDVDRSIINDIDYNGLTPLHYAVSCNYITATKLLLDAGVDIEARDNNGMTPLLVACRNKAFECATFLIGKNADVTAVDNKGCNILHYIARSRYWAAEKVCYITIQVLAKKHVDTNRVCNNGKTALDYALQASNIVMIKTLTAITAGHTTFQK